MSSNKPHGIANAACEQSIAHRKAAKPDPMYSWPRIGLRSIDEEDRILTY